MTSKSTYAADHEKANDLAIDARTVRALEQEMTVCEHIGDARGRDGVFLVVSESGSEYLVDVRGSEPTERCTCADAQHNLPAGDVRACKHFQRVLLTTGARPLPASIDLDDVSDQLLTADHVDGSPRLPAALETIETDDETSECERAIADGGRDRPADCCCIGDDLPCFMCWNAGFRTPAASSANADDE